MLERGSDDDAMHCVLCDARTTVRTIGAMLLTGDVTRPEGSVVCRRCAALPANERKQQRDVAMVRMLRAATVDVASSALERGAAGGHA
jgi:predicted nucleic acid-binding Zn ribbon protein